MAETETAQDEPRPSTSSIETLLDHRETVYLVCLGFTRNRLDAEELAQETYLRAWRRRDQLREDASVKAWLCRIARNTCLDHVRRTRRALFRPLLATTDPPDETDLDAELEAKARRNLLRKAILGLSRPLRDVLVMREYGELSYEQISEALGVAPGTVMSRLHRARARVTEAVRKHGARR